MAISVSSPNSTALLEAIKKSIREGRVTTWEYSNGYFTHTPPQWRGRAFLRPSTYGGELLLNIIRPTGTSISTEVYAVYHGRFIEMLLAHFDNLFDSVQASAMVATGDLV